MRVVREEGEEESEMRMAQGFKEMYNSTLCFEKKLGFMKEECGSYDLITLHFSYRSLLQFQCNFEELVFHAILYAMHSPRMVRRARHLE